MRFVWDEEKNRSNIKTHDFDFSDVPALFDGLMLTALDDREDYGEDRWIGIGFLNDRIAVVIFTEIAENVARIISLRKATFHERSQYEQFLKDRLEAD